MSQKADSTTFHPTNKVYLGNIAGSLFVLGLLAFLVYANEAVLTDSKKLPPVCFGAILLTFGPALGIEFYELWKTRLTIDSEKITGWTKYNKTQLHWSEVIIAERHKQVVLLTTAEATHTISLAELDGDSVWQAIEAMARPQALAPDAYKNHPQYEHEVARYKQLLADETLVIILKHGLVKRIFVSTFTVVVAGVIAVLAATATEMRQWALAALYGFILMGAAADTIRVSTHLKATPRTLHLRHFWYHKSIVWSEVQKVQYNSRNKVWKIYDHEKRITFAVPPSKNTQQFMDLLHAQFWALDLEQRAESRFKYVFTRRNSN